MSNKLDFSEKLDFSDVDLTAPNIVVEGVLQELPETTNNMIMGCISEYSGHVTSYTKIRQSITEAMGVVSTEKEVNIQKDLGKQGETLHKFECYLYTPVYKDYKYRMFFMEYGIAHYPVQFTLEESIARDILESSWNYIIKCNSREEVEKLMVRILTSPKILNVMQELIRINQAQRSETPATESEDNESTE